MNELPLRKSFLWNGDSNHEPVLQCYHSVCGSWSIKLDHSFALNRVRSEIDCGMNLILWKHVLKELKMDITQTIFCSFENSALPSKLSLQCGSFKAVNHLFNFYWCYRYYLSNSVWLWEWILKKYCHVYSLQQSIPIYGLVVYEF